MLGAIAGDIIGSRFEFNNYRKQVGDPDRDLLFTEATEFTQEGGRKKSKISEFTDDTVMTLAVADALMNKKDMGATLKEWGHKYPNRGYGGGFGLWLKGERPDRYNSWGNGSAMRASAAGHFATTAEEALLLAEKSAEITHNHPEGIKGAQAVALGVWMLRNGQDKTIVRKELETRFGYDFSKPVQWYKQFNEFSEKCAETIPPAFTAFFEAENFEQAIRNAVESNGDTDTIAAITGAWAEAAWGVPDNIREEVLKRITPEMREVLQKACSMAQDIITKTQNTVADILEKNNPDSDHQPSTHSIKILISP